MVQQTAKLYVIISLVNGWNLASDRMLEDSIMISNKVNDLKCKQVKCKKLCILGVFRAVCMLIIKLEGLFEY